MPPTSAAQRRRATLKLLTVNVSYRPFSRAQAARARATSRSRRARRSRADAACGASARRFRHRCFRIIISFRPMARGASAYGRATSSSRARRSRSAACRLSKHACARRKASFTVIGVHLNSPVSPRRAAARNAELRELAVRSAAMEGPLVVAGDFNITPYSPFFADWLAVERPHGHAPRPHAQHQLADVVAVDRHSHRSCAP